MRFSRSFLPVLKESPSDAQIVSHKLMLQAGLIRQTAAGIYAWLPIGFRVLKKIEQIVREEQDRAGAVLLFAYDLLYLLEHAEADRQPGVDARGGLADQSRLQHQLVADDLGVGRAFLEDGQETAGETQGEWAPMVDRRRPALRPSGCQGNARACIGAVALPTQRRPKSRCRTVSRMTGHKLKPSVRPARTSVLRILQATPQPIGGSAAL